MEQTFKKKSPEDCCPPKIFAHQLATVDDLFQVKNQLLQELQTILQPDYFPAPKKSLKSREVKRLLRISTRTLQILKASGVIPYRKMGGVHFYDYADIQNVLESVKKKVR
jgi:hypothetical protein